MTFAAPAMSLAMAIAWVGLGGVVDGDGIVAVETDVGLRAMGGGQAVDDLLQPCFRQIADFCVERADRAGDHARHSE